MGIFEEITNEFFGKKTETPQPASHPSQYRVHKTECQPIVINGIPLTQYPYEDYTVYQLVKETNKQREETVIPYTSPEYLDGINLSLLSPHDIDWVVAAHKVQVVSPANQKKLQALNHLSVPNGLDNLTTFTLTFFYKHIDPQTILEEISSAFNIPFTWSVTLGKTPVAALRFRHTDVEKATIIADIVLTRLAENIGASMKWFQHADITLVDSTNGRIAWMISNREYGGNWGYSIGERYQNSVEEVTNLVNRIRTSEISNLR